MQAAAPLVELREVSKWFGPTRSLDRVSFDVRPGEVHVLAGANGAGKSTLIRVLSGVFSDYGGEVLVGGVATALHAPESARRAGIATIHQELPLVGPLPVVDNLMLLEPGPLFGRLPRRDELERARVLLARVGLDVDPRRPLETLPLAARQLVAIAAALGREARVVIFDEPTSALPEPDAERLFELIAELESAGKGVVYISHRMEEIYRLARRITVLRDGRVVRSELREALPEAELVQAMSGRALAREAEQLAAPRSEPALRVHELSLDDPGRPGRKLLSDVGFELARGEILGVAGLQGSGAAELLHTLGGDFKGRHSGRIEVFGAPLSASTPAAALAAGLVLLPSDRALSVFGDLGIVHNATLSSLRRFTRFGFVRRTRERGALEPVAQRLALSAALGRRRAGELSGGNRQRLALARCLLAEPRVLLLDEPTRGVDVAAKADIYRFVRELAAEGVAVIWVASELEELALLSHRVLVLSRGRSAGIFERGAADVHALLRAAMNAA